MTTYYHQPKKCAVCGAENHTLMLGSYSSFGYSDLDFRPPMQARYVIYSNLKQCDNCNFVSNDIENKIYAEAYKKISETESYKSCDCITFTNEDAKSFYRLYLIEREIYGAGEKAFLAIRDTAWVCDDKKDTKSAIACRKIALSFLDDVISTHNQPDALTLIKIDFLRRCNMYDEVLNFNKEFSEEDYRNIFEFQKQLAKIKDNTAHSIKERESCIYR